MRTALTENSEIVLHEIGTLKEYKFKILETVGMGASCIVYNAVFADAENNQFFVRLKEFYPSELKIIRNQNQELVISDKEIFHKKLQHFTDGYKKQMKFRTYPESMNNISNIQGIFEGNNTKYIAMSCQNSIRFEKTELNLYDLFRVLKSVTLQIQNFHNNGWLYLDLKPENILLYPETPELIMLFDFDSALQIGEIQAERLSFTKSWSAPEVVQRKISKIGICSDIYSIGALLMYMLFGRTPEVSDRRSSASWESDFGNCILSDESPEVKRMVTDLLKHTICTDIKSRYKSCKEILDVIEPFIKSFQKQKPYLKTFLPIGTNYFCGRDRELSEIHEILQEYNFLILHGIGGIGKSELAKHYAKAFSENYDAVIFVRYHESIIKTFADDLQFHVEHLQRSENESDEEYFRRKIDILKTICTPKHLIILDNFDTEECENLDELTSLPCKFLITSRTDFEDIFPQYEVDILDDFNDLRAVFRHYSKQDTNEDSDNIIVALEGHTMAVELVSKQMKLYDISSKDMYEKLCEQGISANKEKVKNLKDGSLRNKSAVAHMEVLFNVFNTSKDMRAVFCYIAMIGDVVIEKELLISLCNFEHDAVKILNEAIRGGWIQEYGEFLQVHSLISEVLISQLNPNIESYWKLEKNVTELSEKLDDFSGYEREIIEKIIEHICKHIYITEGSDEEAVLIDFYKHVADMYADRGDFDKAEKYMLDYMNIADSLYADDEHEYKYEYLLLSFYADKQGDFEKADMYLSKAKGKVDEDSFYMELADYFYEKGDYETAREHCFKTLDITDDLYISYSAYNTLVNIECNTDNDIEKIKSYGNEMVKYAKLTIENIELSEPVKYISAMTDLVIAYMVSGDYETALNNAKDTEKIIEENHVFDFVDAILLCLLMGECYGMLGMENEAIEIFDEVIEVTDAHFSESQPQRYNYYEQCYIYINMLYEITDCDIYFDELVKLKNKMIPCLKEDYEIGKAELELSWLYMLSDDEENCISHMDLCIEHYCRCLNENDADWTKPLSDIWQMLLYFGYSDYEDVFNRLIEICEINGLSEIAKENHTILNEILGDDKE